MISEGKRSLGTLTSLCNNSFLRLQNVFIQSFPNSWHFPIMQAHTNTNTEKIMFDKIAISTFLSQCLHQHRFSSRSFLSLSLLYGPPVVTMTSCLFPIKFLLLLIPAPCLVSVLPSQPALIIYCFPVNLVLWIVFLLYIIQSQVEWKKFGVQFN